MSQRLLYTSLAIDYLFRKIDIPDGKNIAVDVVVQSPLADTKFAAVCGAYVGRRLTFFDQRFDETADLFDLLCGFPDPATGGG